ncbi:MAG: PEP-CTERM sorting domain-containing protein [Planctomycetota bacterium]
MFRMSKVTASFAALALVAPLASGQEILFTSYEDGDNNPFDLGGDGKASIVSGVPGVTDGVNALSLTIPVAGDDGFVQFGQTTVSGTGFSAFGTEDADNFVGILVDVYYDGTSPPPGANNDLIAVIGGESTPTSGFDTFVTLNAFSGIPAAEIELFDGFGQQTDIFIPVPLGDPAVAGGFNAAEFYASGQDNGQFQSLFFFADFTDGAGIEGTITIDNVRFVVPEPASLGLLAAGGLAVLGRRRRA